MCPNRCPVRTVRLRLELLVVTALGLAGASRVSATTFLENLSPRVTPIGTALARSIGAALPVTSASAGVIYTFNFETGVPERQATLLGQLFLERPETIGRHRWNLGFSYQHVAIDSLNGDDIDQFHDNVPIIEKTRENTTFTIPRFAIGLDTHEFTTSATVGLSDNLDVNFTVPLIMSEFRLRQLFREQTGSKVQFIPFATRDTKLGIGD